MSAVHEEPDVVGQINISWGIKMLELKTDEPDGIKGIVPKRWHETNLKY